MQFLKFKFLAPQILFSVVMHPLCSHAVTYSSPWSQGEYLDTLRMNIDLSGSRVDYTKLATESYNYAILNAADQKINGALPDSISGTWPQVVMTDLDAYYCGFPIAELVHHSTVWAPAAMGLTKFVKTHSATLTSEEKRNITKTINVAMNGLNFFVSRDITRLSSSSSAFLFRVPNGCAEDQDLS
jgi:hypothetical protein